MYGRLYTPSDGRWLPVDGGPAVIAPTDGGGGGGGGIGDVNAMLNGAASADAGGSDFAALDAVAGPYTCRRSYDSGGLPATFAASVAGIDVGVRASIWSCKPSLADLASGALDSATRAFVASIPDTHVCWITAWHEPDVKIRKGTITLADYLPAFARWCSVVKQAAIDFSKPHVYTVQVMSTWSGQHPVSGSTFADLWPGDGLVDCYAVDGYANVGSGSALWGPAVTFAKSKNIPWAVAEVGCVDTMDTAWMQTQADYAGATAAGGQHTRAAFFCWFSNSTGGVLPTPGTDPAAQAKSKAIAQTYYADVNSYML
jgi:hypothetical protein